MSCIHQPIIKCKKMSYVCNQIQKTKDVEENERGEVANTNK